MNDYIESRDYETDYVGIQEQGWHFMPDLEALKCRVNRRNEYLFVQ